MSNGQIGRNIANLAVVACAQQLLDLAKKIENGDLPDLGTVETLRRLASALAANVERSMADDHA